MLVGKLHHDDLLRRLLVLALAFDRYGGRMIVDHINGDVSVYCHLVPNSEEFSVDQWVRAGTWIAAANSTGRSSGDHLHLKYFQNGNLIEYWDVTGTQPNATQLNGNC
jgi:murein DD-endopeptidase MepM/ murein hydrolase activator NlpD